MKMVQNWMAQHPPKMKSTQLIEDVIFLFTDFHLSGYPVVDETDKFLGIITQAHCNKALLHGNHLNTRVQDIMIKDVPVISPDCLITEVKEFICGWIPVVDKDRKLIGILTENRIIHAVSMMLEEKQKELQDALYMLDTLRTVLNTAYEGVVVVDGNGIIREFNKAYSDFLGVKREDAIGKHVSDVIENTRLHVTVDSGIPERGSIQNILGHEMVVHRMPIWRDGNVVGAIGMVIFQGVSEVYNILNRLQNLSRTVPKPEEAPTIQQPREKTQFGIDGIIGRSEEISKIKRIAIKAAKVPSTVLITGESGTGKEVFARAIHRESMYSQGNFVGVNCAAIPEHLLEAELFGYEEGSFTGAKKGGKIGKFELAHQGTIFLDEIGDMPLYMQAKILRVLEERVVERVGGTSIRGIDVRIISATNKDLEQMVAEGKFREDLFFRLNIIRIQIPSLKERVQDIPYLVSYHLERLCREFRMEPKQFSKEVMNLFMNYSWPGNIRELVNTLEMLIGLVDDDTIRLEHLPPHFLHQEIQKPEIQYREKVELNSPIRDNWRDAVFEQERRAIQQVLIEEKGNKAAVARRLGIHRSTLYEKLKKYHLV